MPILPIAKKERWVFKSNDYWISSPENVDYFFHEALATPHIAKACSIHTISFITNIPEGIAFYRVLEEFTIHLILANFHND